MKHLKHALFVLASLASPALSQSLTYSEWMGPYPDLPANSQPFVQNIRTQQQVWIDTDIRIRNTASQAINLNAIVSVQQHGYVGGGQGCANVCWGFVATGTAILSWFADIDLAAGASTTFRERLWIEDSITDHSTACVPCDFFTAQGDWNVTWVPSPGTIAVAPNQFWFRTGHFSTAVGIDVLSSSSELKNHYDTEVTLDLPALPNPSTCTSQANSTGQVATLTAYGLSEVADNLLVLQTEGAAASQFSLLISGPIAGFTPNFSGSAGNLCIGGAITRWFSTAGPLDNQGQITHRLDLGTLPGNTITSGDTIHFQTWFRDHTGTTNNNTSNACTIAFQ